MTENQPNVEIATIAGDGMQERLLRYLEMGDIPKARNLFTDNSEAVLEAIKEYDTSLHEVTNRPNKPIKGKDPYITEKLTRSWQEYINEVALFFLLNNPIKWTCKTPNSDNLFGLFTDFLADVRFNSTMREAKRLAGAETHSAKLYHVFNDNGQIGVKCIVLSQSKGYNLYPMIDQYGTMLAFGVGYYLKVENKSVEHFDIYTSETIYRCEKQQTWQVSPVKNSLGKINIIYYQQDKEWRQAQVRIERDEMQDSKAADTNNYFADPVAIVTAGIINSLPDTQSVGKLIQAQSKDDDLRYVEPPSSNELKESEKKHNKEAILMDTFTPDFSYENLSGMGTMSGEALKRALIAGYIKRNRNIEIYDILIDREKNLILSILGLLHPEKREALKKLDIKYEFQEPFNEDKDKLVSTLVNAVTGGILSKETAVKILAYSDDSQAEFERIMSEQKMLNEKENSKMTENNAKNADSVK